VESAEMRYYKSSDSNQVVSTETLCVADYDLRQSLKLEIAFLHIQ
jgi:hypothetical protein